MVNFLIFEKFISIEMLIIFYYIGALVFPLLLFIYRSYFFKRYPFLENLMYLAIKSSASRMKIFFLLCIILCEIIWRMMFEVMIGYFQIHDYLQHLQK